MTEAPQKQTGLKDRQMSTWLKWGLVCLFVMWLFFTLSAYFVVQKPLTAGQMSELASQIDSWFSFSWSATAVFRSLLDLLTAIWFALMALGIGLWLLGWLKLPLESALERGLYALGIGFGTVALLVLLLGLAGLLQTAMLAAAAVVLTVAGLPQAVPYLRGIRPSRPPAVLAVFLIAAIGLALFVALLPPFSWDAISYHLKGPQLYLAAGRIQPVPEPQHIAPIYFPNLFEMLFMLAMAIRGDVAAKVIHFLFLFFLGGMVYLIARDQVKVQNPWLAIAFYATIPMVFALAAQAYNDLSLAFYQLGAITAVFQWQKAAPEQKRRWLILSGIFCGFALGHKYTSFYTPIALAAIIAWQFKGRWLGAIRPLFTFSLTAGLVGLPWYLKNIILTGNPVYPFVFGGTGWDDYLSRAYADPGSGIGLDPIALLRIPYDLTTGIHDVSGDGQMGPLFLAFLPLLLIYTFYHWRRRTPRPLRQILFFALVQFLFWTMGVISSAGLWQGRQLFSMFVLLCPVLAWIVEDLARHDHPQFSLRRFVILVLAVVLGLNLISQAGSWLEKAPHRFVLGAEGRDETLNRLLGPHYAATHELAQLLPPEAVVTFLMEPRSYYCQIECRPDLLLTKLGHLEHQYHDADGIAAAWQAEGISHVLVFDAGYEFAVETDMAFALPENENLMDAFYENWLEPVSSWDDAYTLYAIR